MENMSSDDYGRQAYQKIMLYEYKEAVNIINKAIAKYPDDYKLYINRCYCLIHLNEFASAMTDALSLINYFPDIPNGFYLRGDIYMRTGMNAEAEKDFNKLIDMNTDEYLNEISDKLYECKMQQILQKGYEPHLARKALRLANSTKEALTLLGSGSIKTGEDQRDHSFQLTEEEEKFYQQEFEKLENESWITISNKPKPMKKGSKEEMQLNPLNDPQNPGKYCSLWVVGRDHNLIENISKKHEKELEQLFSQYGSLRNVNVFAEKKCIFVNYSNPESAGKALKELQDFSYRNVIFEIEYSCGASYVNFKKP